MGEENGPIIVDWRNMSRYSAIPLEYSFIDKCEVIPGKKASGTKAASSQDWYFKIHFPGDPVMPGVFLMEALQQTGTLVVTTMPEIQDKIMMFQGCRSMHIYKPVRPGDTFRTYVSLRSFSEGIASFRGEVRRDDGEPGELICSMDFTLALPEKAVKVREKIDWGEVAPEVSIGYKDMDDFLADPMEYRFIDRVSVGGDRRVRGIKTASTLDWFFKMHYPGDPSMPECILLEALMQTGVFAVTTMPEITEKKMIFQSCDSCEVFGAVRPGDTIMTLAELRSYRRGIAKYGGMICSADGMLICRAAFTLVLRNSVPLPRMGR